MKAEVLWQDYQAALARKRASTTPQADIHIHLKETDRVEVDLIAMGDNAAIEIGPVTIYGTYSQIAGIVGALVVKMPE